MTVTLLSPEAIEEGSMQKSEWKPKERGNDRMQGRKEINFAPDKGFTESQGLVCSHMFI